MIHIATVHWNTERWIAPQQDYLRRHIKSDFRVYAWLNNIPQAPRDSFYYSTSEPVDAHAVKLNLLADIIQASAARDDDTLIFLDGDAFPIGDIEPMLYQKLPAHQLVAVQRLENNGDLQPHPCFCATTVGFWRQIKGDWKEGYRWNNTDGQDVTDVGGNLLQQLTERQVNWAPLLRSNQVNLHPLFFGIYGGLIYHHGAGFRKGSCRIDRTQLKLSHKDKLLSKILPLYGRKLSRKVLKNIFKKNNVLSEQIFSSIQSNPRFYTQFMPTGGGVAK
jgi:hypothetical protein